MKKIIQVMVASISPYDFDGKVSDVIDRLKSYADEHGPDVRLDWDMYHYEPYDTSPSPRYRVLVTRLETDEEYAKRLAEEAAQQQARDARDRAEFERLQQRFGKEH